MEWIVIAVRYPKMKQVFDWLKHEHPKRFYDGQDLFFGKFRKIGPRAATSVEGVGRQDVNQDDHAKLSYLGFGGEPEVTRQSLSRLQRPLYSTI